ncbi:hypothetical protein V6N11_032708 [Hibiscus sabdariffa]|uniref:F-box domain-containing protein n=1 Tax=Hibiscus sabdariffa TaxID=183260 RepID=A0ABR2T248_9ROSI
MKKRQSKRRFKVPEDLALEILLKLPIKSLVRFNCVCCPLEPIDQKVQNPSSIFSPMPSFPSIESISGVQNLLGFWKNGELFFRGSSHELLLFEPSTRDLKKLGINANQEMRCGFVAYVESLVPINEDQSMMNI